MKDHLSSETTKFSGHYNKLCYEEVPLYQGKLFDGRLQYVYMDLAPFAVGT